MNPTDAADATLATDNYQAGLLIGQWAKAKLGDEAANAVIALLDVSDGHADHDRGPAQQRLPAKGFGIDVGDPTIIGDETDPRIAGHAATDGNQDLGRTAMENLLAANPDINLVYTINEPAAAGAYEAIEAAGLDRRGPHRLGRRWLPGRPGRQGRLIGATSMQFPLRMAEHGVEAAAQPASSRRPPRASSSRTPASQLITDEPQEGVESEDTDWGLENCWG